jgi:hypothetical protein
MGGKKKAEFHLPLTLSPSYANAQDIKQRIDTVTWHGSSTGSSYSEREKEKKELQHALKLLRTLSCDEATSITPEGSTPNTTIPSAPLPLPQQ